MLSDGGFRAQLAIEGQRDLFDYWLQTAGARSMPARSDLDPLQVPRLLPHLGLIDLRQGLDQGRFRLAGTRLREVYGREITGRPLSEVFSGACAAYWDGIHARVAAEAMPAHGVVRGPAEGREHILLFWLRLPLSDDGVRVDRILCHDMAGQGDAAQVTPGLTLSRFAGADPYLARLLPASEVPCG